MLPVTDAAPSLAMTGLGRTFARNDLTRTPVLERFVGGLAALMAQEGYEGTATPGPDTNVVLHVVDADAPKSYRRKAAPTFVIAIAEVPEPPDDMNELRRAGYPFLVRCLANLSRPRQRHADGARGAVRDTRAGDLRRRSRARRRRARSPTCSSGSNHSRRRGW